MPPKAHHTGRPRCNPCVRDKAKCNRKLPACSVCVKYSKDCIYDEGGPATHNPPPVQTPARPGPVGPAGIRQEKDTPTNWGSHASSLTPIPNCEDTPTPPHPGPRRTQSLSSILGDRAPQLGRKRAVRSPSPTLGDEISARAERVRQLRAQLDEAAADLAQLKTIVGAEVVPEGADPASGTQNLMLDLLGDAPAPGPSGHIASAEPDDGVIPGFQASGVVLAIPESVIRNMRGGWRTPFSLTLLRDDYCIAATSRLRKGKTISFGDEGDQLTLAASIETIDANLPEDCLTYEQWVQAWRRLLYLIKQYLSLSLYNRWLSHFHYIDTRSDRSKHWKLWLRYDIAVRVATRFDARLDPSVFHEKIYHDLMPQAAFDAAEALINNKLASIQGTAKAPVQTVDASAAVVTPIQPLRALKPNKHPANPSSSNEHLQKENTGSSMASLSATNTMVPPVHASTHHVATAPTCAPCVDLTSTVPRPANGDPRKVVTPLIPDAWETVLRQCKLWHRFYDIPPGLLYGFRLGTSHSLCSSSIPPNHKSALDNPEVVDHAIKQEIAAGRYSGPFSPHVLDSIIGPFRTAPLGVVAKSKPGEFRIVQDFSYPRDGGPHPALNAEIDADAFPCEWGFFNDIVEVILSSPPNTEAATLDVDAAYRRMPVHPDDQPHIVVMWNGVVWIDHCIPFGARCSNGIFGRCGDAMAHIAEAKGMGPVRKWVDDFVFFRLPPLSHSGPPRYTLQDIFDLALSLGWPWKESKTMPFSHIFTYLGFEWNIPDRTVAITATKRDKYANRAKEWLASPKVSRTETESLLGSLSHCTQVLLEGRPHLSGLIAFCASFSRAHKSRFQTRTAPAQARGDALWWLARLGNSCVRTLRPPHPPSSISLYMDASTSFGIGILVDGHVASWRLTPNWRMPGRDIGWAEMAAVEITLAAVIGRGIKDCRLSFHSDNKGVIFALQAGRSRNTYQNDILMRILSTADAHGIDIDIMYIRSAENPADGPSRGILPPDTPCIDWEFSLPPELSPFLRPNTSRK